MKLNKQIAYALAYILKNKYNAIIANISEMDDNFIVDFDPKNKLSINDFSQVEKDINNFIKENNNIIIKKIPKDKLIKSSNAKINKYYLH
jgi:threonyl-tRNA synthetase